MTRKYLLFGIDLFWVALSPFVALFIREDRQLATEVQTNKDSMGSTGAVGHQLNLSDH